MQIRPNGQVKSGKHQGAYIYLHVNGSIELHSYKLNAGFFTPNDDIPICTLNSGNVESFQYLGKETKADDEGAIRDALWFGAGAGMISSELSKKDFHQLILTYTDKSTSHIEVDTEVYAKLVSMVNAKQQNNSTENPPVQPTVEQPTVTQKTTVQPISGNAASLLDRAFMFLEDGEFDRADEFCEHVLNIDPRCAEAYLGKLMVDLQVKNQSELKDCAESFEDNNNYKKAIRFADEKLATELNDYLSAVKNRIHTASEELRTNAEAWWNDFQKYKNAYEKYGDISFAIKKEKYNIAAYEKKISLIKNLEDKSDEIQRLSAEAQTNEDEIKSLEEKEKALYFERQNLGLFKSKEKKELDNNIDAIKNTINTLTKRNTVLGVKIEELKLHSTSEAQKQEKILELENAINVSKEKIAKMPIVPAYDDLMNRLTEEIVEYLGCERKKEILAIKIHSINMRTSIISSKSSHTVGVKSDGTVVAAGWNKFGQCDVYGWKDIVAVSAGIWHTAGIKSDGTVVAVCSNPLGQCNVDGWKDIVAVSAGGHLTVGLKSDGTVVAVGVNNSGQCNVDSWTDIVAISAGESHTVGLKADGTVVAVGWNEYGMCNVEDWKDIVAISANEKLTVGLKADGTVVAAGWNKNGQYDVYGWKDIVAVSAGSFHIVGLKSDGTVVAAGWNKDGRCDVNGWKDIVAVSAGSRHTVGLKADGTVVAVGYNGMDECNVEGQFNARDWSDILVR